MPRSLFIGLALVAVTWGAAASAQTLGDNFNSGFGGGATGSAPALILPGELTSPITSGLGPEDGGRDPGAWDYQSSEEAWEQPYSVEGEETLEPETN